MSAIRSLSGAKRTWQPTLFKSVNNAAEAPLTREVIFSALTTATAFGSLWLSSHPGMSSMGKLLALSLVCTLTAAVLFQPVLMGPRARFAIIDRANENRAWRKGSTQTYPAAADRMHLSRVIPPTRANVWA